MREIIAILEQIKNLVNDKGFIEKHKKDETSFKRKKKLDFSSMFFFVLALIKQNLDFDREYFSKYFDISVVSSAITQRRSQIKYTAYEEMLEYISCQIPAEKLFKGCRIIAVDGMRGELPRQAELIENYGLAGGSSYPQFHATSFFDVLNETFLCAAWRKYPCDERDAAQELINNKTFTVNSLFLFDRGFMSIKLIKALDDKKMKFVMRANTAGGSFKEVTEFMKSKETDRDISILYDRKRANWNGHDAKYMELPYETTLRFVKVILKNGETEVLITNLTSTEFSVTELGELYNMRWGIETSFNYLKNAVHIETFIGIKDNSIKQEFFASLIVYSLAKAAARCAQSAYDNKKTQNTEACL